MNRYQKQAELQMIQNEEDCRESLADNYKTAIKDVRSKIKKMTKDQDNTEKMLQVKYQLMLEAQIETVLNKLGDKNMSDMTSYLDLMYKDGYLGCLYGMHREGVGLILRLDEEKIKSVVNMDTNGLKFSERLYKNLDKLKNDFKMELARGLSTGSDYETIAANLSLHGEADLKRAYRIVKTEGHRIQAQAKMEAMQEAKGYGADVVKQWDSTVDSVTRESHRELDGQIRELEEKFVSPVTGAAADYPGGFGIAKEDINCRCTLLQRARWAIKSGESGHKYSRFEQKIISMDSESYLEWKHQYRKLLKAQDIKDPTLAAAQKSFQKRLSTSNGSQRHVGLMRMYSECSEYKEDLTLDGAFAYNPADDLILYNPRHPAYQTMDFEYAQAHEVTHRMDILEYESYNNEEISEAFEQSRTWATQHLPELKEMFDENISYRDDPGLCDIFMTLTGNKLELPFGHQDEYISDDLNAVIEIFADISAMDVLENTNMAMIKEVLPELLDAYKGIVG